MKLKTLHRRKRKYFLFILLLCMAGMTKMYAYDFSAVCETGQTLYYNITNATNHYVELTYPGTVNYNGWSGYTKPTGDIILPESVQNAGITYTVTSIGNYALDNCYGLTGNLNIPNSVISIGTYAFGYCSGLTSIVIPNFVASIENYAFHSCSGLTSIAIPSSVISIGTNPFSDCSNLAQIIVDSGNTVYDSRESCNAIIKTNTNKLITGCKNTVIPNTVTSIESWAFYGSNSLISIVIPNSVTSMGTNPFARCSGLAQIIVDSENTVYDSRENCNAIIETNINELVTGCKNTVIPNSVSSIGYYAFGYCSGLTSITIPNSVTTIGNYAFHYCSGLTSIAIPNSVTTIGNYAFYYCSELTSIAIPNSVTTIGNYAFYYCSGLTGSLTIPNSVTSIGNYAFYNCSSITGNLTIPNSMTSIGNYTFYNCSGFSGSLTIPNTVSSIGSYAFYNCSGFISINSFAETPPSIGNLAFQYVNHSIPVTVPCGKINAYQNASGWSLFTNYPQNCPSFIVTATANPLEGGSMTVGGRNLVYDFENNSTQGWTTLKGPNGNSPNNWMHCSVYTPRNYSSGYGHNYSDGFMLSESYISNVQENTGIPVYPDNYLVSPQIVLGGSIHFWATNPNDSYGEEHFAVAVSTNGNTNVSNFTQVQEWTLQPSGRVVRTGNTRTIFNNIWYEYTADLSGFSGLGYVAIHHFNCYDQWFLCIDDITIAEGTIDINSFSGTFIQGQSFTMNAIPNTGYYFVNWTENGSMVSSNASYTVNVTSDRNLVANFSPIPHEIIATPNPIEGGTVSGTGTYYHFDTCSLTAIPNEGYLFDSWTNQGNIVSDSTTYNFIVSEDATFVANFIEKPVLDTTIYIDICHGEDYIENGFEIFYPEVGIGNYSLMFHPSFEYDSIVNLILTVHPTYYLVEDTTLCNATSFQWHGNTYTESGTYYDSLQTIHGCDSIYALSLEFFNTPLGEFAGMTPTNNYPFSSLPITFSWDAVSGAEYYNLYLWNVNDPAPSTPFAGNIYNRSCYVPSLQNHQTYNWYIEAVNTCFSTTSSVRSFSLNIPPTMSVSASNLNFGEVALNNSNTLNLYVSGNALDDTITMQLTGEDASMFSYVQGSNWNGLTGGLLSVTFSPMTVQYNYTANLVITTGTLTQTVQLTGSLADMFVFNTFVTQDVFEMNSTVPIYGTVLDANNNPAASAEVEVKVTVMNMTRSLFATTGADGHFSVDFVPAYSESGYYTVNSGRVGHNSTAVHDDFNIPGMNLVTNDWILWDVVQNETSTGSIVIRNRSQIPLNNIQVTANTLPDGCSFTFQPLSLAGMEEGVLEYSVSGTTPINGYQEVALVATSSEGATMNFTVWYRCAEPRGILYAAPNNITTTMTKGKNKIVDVMLYNNGTGPTGSVYLDLPSVDWLSVVGNDTLPSIAVQDSAYFSLRLSANENTPLVQYTGNIAINCERGDGFLLPYTIMAVSDSTGTLVVDVTDDYTYNGNGQHLQGAMVTVKGYYSLETVAVGLTDSNGLFTVSDIPEGYYRMSITAPHHAEYQATIQIEGGQTNTQDIYLQYQAITYSWNVVPTEIQDEYTFELIVEYETNVPVPVVVIDMPQTFPELAEGESFAFDYIISNLGLVDTYEATLYPPTNHPLYDFTPLVTEIDTLHAQTSIVIPCTMTVRAGLRSPLVYAALDGRGERDGDCPDMAETKVQSYYYCNGEKVYVTSYKYVQIGSHPCETPPSGSGGGGGGGVPGGGGSGGGGGHYSGSGGSGTPPVTTQQQGCSEDPNLPGALQGAMGEMGGCPPPFDGTPKLPPIQPQNNRRKNN